MSSAPASRYHTGDCQQAKTRAVVCLFTGGCLTEDGVRVVVREGVQADGGGQETKRRQLKGRKEGTQCE